MAVDLGNGDMELSRGGELLDRIAGFGRYLRRIGLPVSIGQVMDLVQAVEHVGLSREDFRLAARSILLVRKEDAALFDEAFDLYWRSDTFLQGDTPQGVDEVQCVFDSDEPDQRPERRLPPPNESDTRERSTEIQPLGMGMREAPEDQADQDALADEVPVYSPLEVLRTKDFAEFTPEEVEQARHLMLRINWEIGSRLSRRTVRSNKGNYLDMRRAFRTNMRYGEPMELGRRRRKIKPRQLVLLCDVSGSMDCYSRLLLQFLHTVEHGPNPSEVFVFGTRLTRITRQLRIRNVDEALDSVADEVVDWAGGTCIGESLRTFNTRWSRRVLRKGAVVLVISDGWDRGDTDLLAREMERLQRSSYRLIWLNPLLGAPSYQPLTRGIQAALPYVDDFLPIHNLDNLESLALVLSELGGGRPERRQRLADYSAATTW